MSLLRSLPQGLRCVAGQSAAMAGAPRLFSTQQEVEDAAAGQGGNSSDATPAKRVALPHKVTRASCGSYQEYLQQRWRFNRPETNSLDARALYRLANMLEYQTIQGLKLQGILQDIITQAVEKKERHRQAGADPKVVEDMTETISRMIGSLVWFRGAHRPTFEATAKFRGHRTAKFQGSQAEQSGEAAPGGNVEQPAAAEQ